MGETTTDLLSRIDIRKQARRRRRIRRIAAAVVALGLVVAGIWLVAFSPVLNTRDVQVQGNQLLSQDEVLQTAEVPLGIPLARVRTDSIKQRLLTLAPVASADVSRSFPHTVSIELTERTAVFQRENKGTFQWVDAGGKIFHSQSEPSEVVTVSSSDDSETMMADVAEIVLSLTPAITEPLERIEVRSRDNIVLVLSDDREVNWGSAEDSQTKAAVLESLLPVSASAYDVSAPGSPAVRPR